MGPMKPCSNVLYELKFTSGMNFNFRIQFIFLTVQSKNSNILLLTEKSKVIDFSQFSESFKRKFKKLNNKCLYVLDLVF